MNSFCQCGLKQLYCPLKAYSIFFVTGEEDQSFSFHEENSAAGNFGSKNMRIPHCFHDSFEIVTDSTLF